MEPLSTPQSHLPRTWRDAAIIALLPLVLIAFCWRADFVGYDDPMHVSENSQIEAPLTKLFECRTEYPFFPITLLTYKIDHALFSSWMPAALGSWAPGVRFMTLVYHILVALVVWRIFLLLGLSSGQSLFIACAFAVHPLASETVCWTSERKNAVAALLGFLSLYTWLRFSERPWRVPVASVLYGLALLSKQSVLGLLPIFALLELFGGAEGLSGVKPMCWRPGWSWYGILARIAPLAIMAGAMVVFTMMLMSYTIVPTPGGSVIMALMTDLEILCRYIFNLLVPTNLSAIYAVDSVHSWSDPRIYIYGAILISVVAASIFVAENRRRAAFGWLWLLGSLGPNLNLIANPHLMQDRYLYLGTPGFFLVVVEVFCGLRTRVLKRWKSPTPLSSVFAGAYIALFVVLSLARGSVWDSSQTIFEDAVLKEPHAGYARYALGKTYLEISELMRPRAPEVAMTYRARAIDEWKSGVDSCPDVYRFNSYLSMALEVGTEYSMRSQFDMSEHYWLIAAARPTETIDDRYVRATAFASLASLRMEQKRYIDALDFATEAASLWSADKFRILHARAALAVAEVRQTSDDNSASRSLVSVARDELKSVPETSELYGQAQLVLRHRLFATP